MQLLKSIGGVANGWAKFVVTLFAMGWFGVYALNEVTSQETTKASTEPSSVSRYDKDLLDATPTPEVNAASTDGQPIVDSPLVSDAPASASVVRSFGTEIWGALSVVFGAKLAQLILAFLSGTGLGLAGRPALSRFNQNRRLAAARKRILNLEQDRQLLAAAGIVNGEPRTAASVVPPTSVESVPSVQSPKV
jgi:hypothetical protein